ncbi:hypothetical protein [Marinilabilia rubra]|uniref:Outer membrane protein beta-barrel domain-containing protein n=1 Tax=Marinilabilia rubra TaxID=2162893 RepID=A0A2U2B3I1_9BACT|nr:hypothetical protein [Marinilabilia rubra]PWD97604.1 hypothetical protein DDZ16_19890 [Marinilabilia rubra]
MKKFEVRLLIAILISGYTCLLNAQTKKDYLDFSVITPENYNQEEKKYPLIVCYKGHISDSLFIKYSTDKQLIILLFDTTQNLTSNPEYQKEIILKIKNDYSVSRDKIYLLGVNQNIEKTIKTKNELDYYFGATVYITNNPDTYTYFTERVKQYNNVKHFYVTEINSVALDSAHQLFLQNRLWEIDIHRISEDAKTFNKPIEENNWQISLSYGQWGFNNSAKSNDKTILDFPKNMGSWNLSFARYFSESISVNANVGIQIKKLEPDQPDFFTVLNGGDIDIEGAGLTFIPLSIGMDYFFMKQRFRPFLGVGIGSVSAKTKLIEASGNMNDGINKDELEFSSKAPFVELSSGFVYRTGENVQLGLNCDYVHSKDFDENIGGYKSFTGLKISAVFSIVF